MLQTLIDAAKEKNPIDNLEFQLWDYSKPKPTSLELTDMLVTSFGVDFPLRREHESLDRTSVRQG